MKFSTPWRITRSSGLLGLAFLWLGYLLTTTPTLAADAPAPAPDPQGIEFFEQKIRPVLVEHCLKCHSAEAEKGDNLKGSLLLDTRAGMRKGGDSGPSLIPGKANESFLMQVLKHEGEIKMPPKKKLPQPVLDDFEAWINRGAPDPRDGQVQVKAAPVINIAKGKKFWAFQAPQKAPLPELPPDIRAANEIDRFIAAGYQAQGLKQALEADARTLIRRMSFDVIGLPPTPEEVEAFLKDCSETSPGSSNLPQAAVERLADRLLSSPHYGERWARHWLDVARFAEDQAHTFGVKPNTNAYQYRDWVIRMLNDDLPYDQFIRMQLAGDLIPNPADNNHFVRLAGLGFNGLGAQYYKNSDAAKAAADELDDRVDTVTRAFLGLTVACARCHDHKFDPIPTRDYYSLAGLFQGSSFSEMPLVPQAEVDVYQAAFKKHQEAADGLKKWLRELATARSQHEILFHPDYLAWAWKAQTLKEAGGKFSLREIAVEHQLDEYFLDRCQKFLTNKRMLQQVPQFAEWLKLPLQFGPGEKTTALNELTLNPEFENALKALVPLLSAACTEQSRIQQEFQLSLAAAATPEERAKLKPAALNKEHDQLLRVFCRENESPFFMNEDQYEKKYLEEQYVVERSQRIQEIESLKQKIGPKYPEVHTLRGGGTDLKVFLRGNPATLGEQAPRGFLQVLSAASPAEQPSPTETASPSTANPQKVPYSRLDLANDIASPQNPLTARVMVNRIWQQHFGRGLVSTASNFGSLGDRPSHPELLDWLAVRFMEQGWSLKWLHRQILCSATYRLSSSQLSDNNQKDADNKFLWRMNRRRLEVEAWRDALLSVSGTLDQSMGGPTFDLGNAGIKRRTVYAKISRHNLNSLLNLFDFPDANVTSATRTSTTVPQQQLFVLNSGFMLEQARSFSKRLEAAGADDGPRIETAYQLAYGRPITPRERAVVTEFLAQARETAQQPPEPGKPSSKITPWEQLAHALLVANEFLYID